MAASPVTPLPARIRLGTAGGGEGAFIGGVHRMAARLDNHCIQIAGALRLGEERICTDDPVMAQAEARRRGRIEAVVTVTPNHLPVPVASAFLNAHIHVTCDEPLARTPAGAKRLPALAARRGLILPVTDNQTAHPRGRQARQRVRRGRGRGRLSEIRVVPVESAQDWLSTALEDSGREQADERTDPARAGAGAGGRIGDIGSQADPPAEFISALELRELCAEPSTFVTGRRLDDNDQGMRRFGRRGKRVAVGQSGGAGQREPVAHPHPHPHPHLQPAWRPVAGTGTSPPVAVVSAEPGAPDDSPCNGLGRQRPGARPETRPANAPGKRATRLDPAVRFATVADGVKGVAFIQAVVKTSAAGRRGVRCPVRCPAAGCLH